MNVDGYPGRLNVSGNSFSGTISISFIGAEISQVLTGSASIGDGQVSIAGDLMGYINGIHVTSYSWSGQKNLPEVIYVDDIPVLTGN